jgi:hypothetical protein
MMNLVALRMICATSVAAVCLLALYLAVRVFQ